MSPIRTLRLRNGYTQRQVAKKAGIHHGYLSQIEKGVRSPSIRVLRAVLDVLGASVVEFEEITRSIGQPGPLNVDVRGAA